MPRRPPRLFCICLLTIAALAGIAKAQTTPAPAPQSSPNTQQIPPPEPPQPMPGSQNGPTLRVTTREVLVPTLVEKRDGGILYGLKAGDFVVEDNGVPQKVHVQEELDSAPVSLVVAVEQGGMSVLEFDKFARLAPLLELFLSDPRSQAALVGFDSEPHLVLDFTRSEEDLNDDLRHLQPGDGGDAILDTVSYAVDLLETQPKDYRRVLLLISQARDHGSKHTKITHLIKKIGESDVLVLTVEFSPMMAEFTHDLKDSGDERVLNPVSALAALIQAFRKNITKEIANMSGGEYTSFITDKKFEQRVLTAARDSRNRYLLTFSPAEPTPGLHTIRVHLSQGYSARIVARANYWIGEEEPDGAAQ